MGSGPERILDLSADCPREFKVGAHARVREAVECPVPFSPAGKEAGSKDGPRKPREAGHESGNVRATGPLTRREPLTLT